MCSTTSRLNQPSARCAKSLTDCSATTPKPALNHTARRLILEVASFFVPCCESLSTSPPLKSTRRHTETVNIGPSGVHPLNPFPQDQKTRTANSIDSARCGCENQSLCVSSLQALEDNVHISLVCNDGGNVHQLVSQDTRVVDGHVFDDRVVIIGHEEAQISRLFNGQSR